MAAKKIKYKKSEFTVKANVLGIGRVISDLAAGYEDEMLAKQYHIVKLPDFGKYQEVINNITSLTGDKMVQAAKLDKLKNKTTAEAKELQKIINADNKALEAEYKVLESPALSFIAKRMISIRQEVEFGFINDLEIFKTLCSTLLDGDVSVIEYSNIDKDLLELRDEVYRTFFTIRKAIYKQLTIH